MPIDISAATTTDTASEMSTTSVVFIEIRYLRQKTVAPWYGRVNTRKGYLVVYLSRDIRCLDAAIVDQSSYTIPPVLGRTFGPNIRSYEGPLFSISSPDL
jgi:hypothetical protein